MNTEPKKDVDIQFNILIFSVFQMMLSEEEYQMTHTKAQELYNKICSILFLVPTTITGDLSVRANP